MPVIEWKADEGVAVVVMNNGENRHNPLFVKSMLEILDEIEEDKSISSVVITSSDNKNWSQGIDLAWIMGEIQEGKHQAVKDFLYGINDIFKRILLYPVPVIAGINGHTVGNGSILACACDFRFMRSDRGFFFFPEIDINIPFLPGMIALVKKSIPGYKFEEMVFTGKRYAAAELEKYNIIYGICENEEVLMEETVSFAKSFTKGRGIFGEMKKRMHREIIDIIDEIDPPLIENLSLIVT